MKIFKVSHTDMMGFPCREEYYLSKNKAKKALKRMFKSLKENIVNKDDVNHLSKPVEHRKQIMKKSARSNELMFEVWQKVSHEYDEWDTFVEGLHIEKIEVN